MKLSNGRILLICLFALFIPFTIETTAFNLSLPHQHPDPEAVAEDVKRQDLLLHPSGFSSFDEESMHLYQEGAFFPSKKRTNAKPETPSTIAGDATPIGLATANPTPHQAHYATLLSKSSLSGSSSLRTWPSSSNMNLFSTVFKTIDGRGANVHITGNGCITLQFVTHIIIHNIHVHHCKPSGNTNIASSPTQVVRRGESDGDGISIYGSQKIWIDHCSLSYCTDGLIDAIMGSTAITISNSHFAHHDEVMLLGHNDKYVLDSGMQVTIAFNHFGVGLVQRMPRCRRGYIHVVNNDFTAWEMYAIGGSASPTINSQGNRYTAPADDNAKEVTKRVDTNEGEWADWNWRTDEDMLVNGAFFVPSGAGLSAQYGKASSVEPRSARLITQLTMNAGVFGDPSKKLNIGGESPCLSSEMIAGALRVLDSAVLGPMTHPPPPFKGRGPVAVMATTLE
ncbi:PECTATE LYASE 18-RELATED [Salix koriyanagi]|uniref:Pectate lyase n=1 Tax=Salix koriyanagi TaxID=2511006 RepID=A0A9Q0WIA9_9ROSI|nr:PECTATE LYASE 18-RELATED [Salix koriyanagi]